MPVHQNVLIGASGQGGGYTIENAIYLEGNDYLERTPSSAGNLKTYTLSFWAKVSNNNTSNGYILDAGAAGANSEGIRFTGSSDTPLLVTGLEGAGNTFRTTSAIYRDPTAWMHVVYVKNTADSTADDRIKIFVNGARITDFSSTRTVPLDEAGGAMNTTVPHRIGANIYSSTPAQFYQGYLAEYIFLDGYAGAASDFAREDDNGVWVPIDPTTTVAANKGTNGFWLEFKDSSDIGKDSSGNTDHQRVTTTGGTWANASGFSSFDATKFDNGGYNDARCFKVNGTGNRFTYDHGSGNSFALSRVGMANDNAGANSSAAKWKVEYSDNGSDWTDTGQFCDYTDGGESSTSPQYATITGQSAHRYWAWEVTVDRTAHTSHGTYEIELYEDGASYWTVNSIAATQQVTDTPSDDADNNIGNYATLSPTDQVQGASVLSEGNLKITGNGNHSSTRSTFQTDGSGKFAWEVTVTSQDTNVVIGLMKSSDRTSGGDVIGNQTNSGWALIKGGDTSSRYNNSDMVADIGASATNGDVYHLELDNSTGDVFAWRKPSGGTFAALNSGNTITAGAGKTALAGTPVLFAQHVYQNTSASNPNVLTYNFGQTSFAQTPSSGYKAVNTANLPAPTVTKPSDFFNTVLYTGNGGTQAITGVGFQPDFLWIKGRSVATNWNMYDAVRTANSMIRSNVTNAEQTGSDNELSSFDADGFTVTHASGVVEELNRSSETYVAHCWKAGASNTSVSSSGSGSGAVNACTHRANTTSGLSIIKYTGFNSTISNGEHTLITHGLGSPPVIMMGRSLDSSQDWFVLPGENGGGTWATDNHMHLNTSDQSSGALHVQPAFPTSTAIKIGNDDLVNKNGDEFLMYAWIRVPGLVGYGTYTGNGSADGPMVVVNDGGSGFKPAWIMIKRTSGVENWIQFSSKTDIDNPAEHYYMPDAANAENDGTGGNDVDFLANGFKLRSLNAGTNASSSTYIYLAFAEHPFGGDGVAQARAR